MHLESINFRELFERVPRRTFRVPSDGETVLEKKKDSTARRLDLENVSPCTRFSVYRAGRFQRRRTRKWVRIYRPVFERRAELTA